MSAGHAFLGAVGALVFLGLLYFGIRAAYLRGLRRPPDDPSYPGCVFWAAGPFVAVGLFPFVGWWSLAALPGLRFFTQAALAVAAFFGRRPGACRRHARASDPKLRGFGVEKLIRCQDPGRNRESRIILEESLEFPDGRVFETVALELIRLGQGGLVVEAMTRRLRKGAAPESVSRLLAALGPSAVDPLARVLADPETPVDIRKRLVNDLHGFAPLTGAARDPDEGVRVAAVERITSADALLAATSDASIPVRRAALGSLAKLKDKRVAGPALEALAHPDLRRAAAIALGEAAVAEAGEPLTALLDDGDAGVREAAARALGAVGERKAIGRLAAALTADPVHRVRVEAALALKALGWTPGTPEERTAKAVALAEEGPLEAAALGALEVALRDLDGAETALPRLEALLRDQAAAVGEERLKALAGLDGVKGPPPERSNNPTPLDCGRVRELAAAELRRRVSGTP